MGVAEDAFERLRRVAFEGEHVERMAALGAQLQLSPGVIKTLTRLGKQDGVSMGEMARGIGVDPSYITALVDDLDARGLARREPAPYDRRVKIIVLTDAGARSQRTSTRSCRCRRRLSPASRERSYANCAISSTKWWRHRKLTAPCAPTTSRRSPDSSAAAQTPTPAAVPAPRREPPGPVASVTMSSPAIHVEHLSKSYGDTVAVRDVSFEVQKGEVFALLGPNGAGKTTTVEILEGFRDRSGGSVRTLGVDPADHSTQRWLRTRIGVVLQELAIEPYYSVRQVLSRNAGYYPSPRPIDEVIELIGLREKADERIKKLSGGQQRRLDVGLGIIGNPDLLFLDEPTTGLDPAGRRDTWDLIKRLSSGGTTVLLTTHYMDEVEALAHRVAVLFGQEIVASGTPSSIGGRDMGAVTIRFRLPDGVGLGELPFPAEPAAGEDQVLIHTEDELRVLHELTGWALDGGHALAGLSVLRESLEDVYLGLTRSDA